MERFFAFFLLATSISSASSADAGWVGGGGAFIEDGDNPWFIQNTKTVNYCIWADEEAFGLSQQQLQKITADAFQFWKNQITKVEYTTYADRTNHEAKIEVGTQTFSEVSCRNNPDIVLQFGVLTDAQRDHLQDPTKYAGISVRTEYDRVNLRGKGFVYLSPQNGPLKLKHSRLDQPWSFRDGLLAKVILTHELQHVFGFQHDDASFLTASSIANILDYSGWALDFLDVTFARLISGKDFLFASNNSAGRKFAGRIDFLKQLWGIDAQETGTSLQVEDGRLLVYGLTDLGSTDSGRLVGSASLRKHEFGPDRRIGYFWFPKEQKVFPGFEMDTSILFGSTHSIARYEGTYRSLDGSITRQVKITAHDASNVDIGGELDGKMYIDFWQGI